jgi:hypothetical protein
MATSLVLHIGDPKTGTSSIQEVLRHKLWHSPSATLAYPEQLNSFPLANALSDPKQADQRAARWGRFAEWLRATEADVAVVSAEQFFRVDPNVLLEALTEFVPEYVPTLRVIAYVRPHANRMVSAFMQRSKAGLFQGDMATFFDRTKGEQLLHYAPRFERWRATFGDRFTLRPMIRSQLRDGDVVSDFLDFSLKGAPFEIRSVTAANTSLPLEFLAGLSDVQSILRRNKIAPGTRHSVGDHIGRALMSGHPGAGTRLQISQTLYQDLKAHCQGDAEQLDREFFGQPLMAQALEEAGRDATQANQDARPQAHFPDPVIQVLHQRARRLVAMFRKRPTAWTVAFERDIGQRPPAADGKSPPPLIKAHIDKVNAVLADIADLIGGGSPASETRAESRTNDA